MKPNYTYRVVIADDEHYQYISFYKWALALAKVNKRPVHCGKCVSKFSVGECVWHKSYKQSYFICIPCAKELILRHGGKGFGVNILSNLIAIDINQPKFTAQQIADSIVRFTYTLSDIGLPILSDPGT